MFVGVWGGRKGRGSLLDWPRYPWTSGGQEAADHRGCTSPEPLPLGLKENREAKGKGLLQMTQEPAGGSPALTELAPRARVASLHSGVLLLWTP